MRRVMRQFGIRCTKRLALGAGLLSMASALGAGGYLISHSPNRATPSDAPKKQPSVNNTHQVELHNPLFRSPLDAQESLFVRIECEFDNQEGAPKRYGVVQYGIGIEAARIEKRLRGPQFGDTEHGLWVVDHSERQKGEPILDARLLPAGFANRSFRVALPIEARPKSADAMRVRKQIDASGAERTQQVEIVRFERRSKGAWQIGSEALYVRGSEGQPSTLQWRSEALAKVSPEANWWVVAWLTSEAPRNERLVIVGVLTGQFVSRDGSVRLRAGEAACIRLSHNATSETVEYVQPAELRLENGRCVLRWDAAVDKAYRLVEAKLYAVPDPLPVLADSVEAWSKLSRGAITLDASWYWATQKPLYCPDF